MVTAAEIRKIAERWKKGTQPLKINEQQYGHRLVKMLEEYEGQDLPVFDDPLEAAIYIIMVGMVKDQIAQSA